MCPRGNSAEGRGNCWVYPLLHAVIVGRVAPGCEVPGAFSLLRTLAKLTPTVRKPLQGKSVEGGGSQEREVLTQVLAASSFWHVEVMVRAYEQCTDRYAYLPLCK